MESIASRLETCRFISQGRNSLSSQVVERNRTGEAESMWNSTAGQGHMEYFLLPTVNVTQRSMDARPSPPTVEDHGGFHWFEIVIPIICFIGIVGNLLNLVVLTRRRMLSSMGRLERCATYGLAALALSDMMFCLLVVPLAFIDSRSPMTIFTLYYKIYGIGLINLFMMVSNWLTVVIATNRFLVVMYPIQARTLLSTGKTLTSIILVLVCSVLISLPNFMHLRVSPCVSNDGQILMEHQKAFPYIDSHLRMYIRWVFPVFSVFIPLALLAFCNAGIIRELNSAALYRKNSCRSPRSNGTSHKVTLTLVIIVLMLFLLVSPSEILKYINPYKSWGKVGYVLAHVTNILQATNFALNFFLYLVVNPNFRRTIMDTFLRCGPHTAHNSLDDSQTGNGHDSTCAVRSNLINGKANNKHKLLTPPAKDRFLKECHTTITAL